MPSIQVGSIRKKCEIQRVCLDRDGAYGLHVSPSPEALRATQKSIKNLEKLKSPLKTQENKTVPEEP